MLRPSLTWRSEEHQDTIWAIDNLANTLGGLGQLDEAVSSLEVTEEEMRRVRGDQHPCMKVVAGYRIT